MTDEQLLAAVERYMGSGRYSGREEPLAWATLAWAKARGADVGPRRCECGDHRVDAEEAVFDRGIRHDQKACRPK